MVKSKISQPNILNFLKNRDIWVYFGIILLFAIIFRPRIESDTQALLSGVDYALGCISARPMLIPCGPAVVHFPIFQYLIAVPLKVVGFKNSQILKIFSCMSLVWFFISCVVFWRAGCLLSGKPGGTWGYLSCLVAICSGI